LISRPGHDSRSQEQNGNSTNIPKIVIATIVIAKTVIAKTVKSMHTTTLCSRKREHAAGQN
jgi:hypothetical protein